MLGKHPTQKPLELLDRIIRCSSHNGDLVIDPFCGSGTTGMLCWAITAVLLASIWTVNI